MPTIHRRSTWIESGRPVTGPGSSPERWQAVVYHYPGGTPNTSNMPALVRQMHRSYLSLRGYSLGYCYVIGPAGDIYEVRGLDIRNAANNGVQSKSGVANYNPLTVSVQFAVQGDAGASEAALDAAAEVHLMIEARCGRLLRVEGHGDKDATPCPGDGIRAQLPRLRLKIVAARGGYQPPTPAPAPAPSPAPLPPSTTPFVRKGTPDMAILTRWHDGTIYVLADDLSCRLAIDQATHDSLKATGRYAVAKIDDELLTRIPSVDGR